MNQMKYPTQTDDVYGITAVGSKKRLLYYGVKL